MMTDHLCAQSDVGRAATSGIASPERLADLLPSRPVLTSPQGRWPGIELQMYRHPPGTVQTPGARDHVLVLNLAGRVLIDDISEGRRRTAWADAGHFSLTPAGQPVRRAWQGRPEILLIFLGPALLRTVAEELDLDMSRIDLVPRLAEPDPTLHHLGCLLRREAAGEGLGSRLIVDGLARALAVHLLRHHSSRAAQVETLAPVWHAQRLKRAMEYMRAHLDEPVSLPRLAALCGVSTAHFVRIFREATGQAPHAYLVGLRLTRARELLERTSLSVTEIAFSCGFEQSQYFATVFRRKLGVTPSAWRRGARPALALKPAARPS